MYGFHFYVWGEVGVEAVVDFDEGVVQFASYRHPFCGFEVVVLEEEHQGGGEQEGGVLAVELRFTIFGWSVRGWLGWWETGDWWWGADGLVDWWCRGYG